MDICRIAERHSEISARVIIYAKKLDVISLRIHEFDEGRDFGKRVSMRTSTWPKICDYRVVEPYFWASSPSPRGPLKLDWKSGAYREGQFFLVETCDQYFS